MENTTERKQYLIEELNKKFNGGIPKESIPNYEEFDEEDLDLMLDEREIVFKENHHYNDYIDELKNNDYYKELLEDYLEGESTLTDKQVKTAQLVDKILRRANKHPNFFNNEDINLKNDNDEDTNKKERKEVNDTLSKYKNVDVEEALDIAEEDEELTVKV